MLASRHGLVTCLTAVLTLGCAAQPSDADTGDDADTNASSGETGGPPPGCPAFEFPEFEQPYGQLYCEVYIGCFGEVGGREPGDPVATTIPDCLELTCGNGDVNLDNESECSYDDAQGAACLAAMMAIADDLSGCPDIDDPWFPDACGLAIECALP